MCEVVTNYNSSWGQIKKDISKIVRVEGSMGRFHRSSKRERGAGRGHRV